MQEPTPQIDLTASEETQAIESAREVVDGSASHEEGNASALITEPTAVLGILLVILAVVFMGSLVSMHFGLFAGGVRSR